ncbi:hypothetical protein NBE98_03350 [Clostridium swellfunianum]|uniref:hypothetical protein n=1 Tax=Clostridium swellfunianum TaxID=1367462 RepID=UPI00202F2FC2|nr:hypothetical protein [Clostridium swellfunianum]MCM0647412.1 hypothetical protein [Clostridium swellfunianum]
MDFKLVKKISEICPQSIKILLAPILRKKLINNKVFLDTYKMLDNYDTLSNENKKNLQFENLKSILIYCNEHVNYYKEAFKNAKFNPSTIKSFEDIKALDFTNKSIFLNNEASLLSDEDINHYIAYTGGSSGKPLKIYLDKDSIYKERAYVYHYWAKFGYDYKTSRMITFRGLEFNGKISKFNPIYNEIVLSPFKLNDESYEKYIKIIDEFKAEFISGYPSAIKNFCALLDKNKTKLNIKSVFYISESCSREDDEYIKKVLKCDTCIFYGHSERAVFAEKYDEQYVFNDMYGYTEFIPTDNPDEFRIACTGFLNFKMPFVRYLTDDVVRVIDNKVTEIIGHNTSEMLIGKNNEKISIAAINFHSDAFNKIRQYQFEQFEIGKVNLNLLLDKDLIEEDISNIKKALNKKVKDILDIEIKIVNEIKLTKRGKKKLVIQHIDLYK